MLITIPGEPISKQRHRCKCIRGRPHAYDEQANHEMPLIRGYLKRLFKKLQNDPDLKIKLEAIELAQAQSFQVELTFHMSSPESLSQIKKNGQFWGLSLNSQKPDCDNLAKFILDCANGVIWPDDAMIVSLSCKKVYSENPRTEIKIMSKKELIVHEKVEGILKVFSPNLIKEFLKDASEISSISPANIEKMVDETDAVSISQMAVSLSEFAEKYEPYLHKIRKFDGIREDLIHEDNFKNQN